MIKTYKIFDMGTIEFDDSRTVSELAKAIFEQEDYYEPSGMQYVTFYDIRKYRIALDNTHTCAEENLSDWLCVAYFKPGVYYYAEGGWGHHMIQMNAVEHIKNPISFILKFDDFNGSPVFCGDMSIGHLVESLKNTDYLENECHTVKIYNIHYDAPDKKLLLELDMKNEADSRLTLCEIKKSVCYIGMMTIE